MSALCPGDFLRPLQPRQRAISMVLGPVQMTRSLVCGMAGVSTMHVVVMRRTCASERQGYPQAKPLSVKEAKIGWREVRFSPNPLSTPLLHGGVSGGGDPIVRH
jgi:hypothetical protein